MPIPTMLYVRAYFVLQWGTCILLREVSSLGKLSCSTEDTFIARIFTTIAIENINVIYHLCSNVYRILESSLQIYLVHQCLHDPESAPSMFCSIRDKLLKQDFDQLVLSAQTSPSDTLTIHLCKYYLLSVSYSYCSQMFSLFS